MALATLFVLTLASGASWAAWHWLLEPLGLGYLRTLVFVLLIAAVVQGAEMIVRATSPLLHELLGVFLPLITTNCAVLGVALINLERQHGFVESLIFGAAAAAGFGLALLLFAGLRERMDTTDVPAAFRGTPIALVTAGLMALAFMGFSGLVGR